MVSKSLIHRVMPLFHSETMHHLMLLSYHAHICQWERDDVIVEEGKRPPRMHVVMSGEVTVSLSSAAGACTINRPCAHHICR